MTPFSSVAILEKLALLKVAFCRAPVFSRASSRRTSVITSTAPAASSGRAVIASPLAIWLSFPNVVLPTTPAAGSMRRARHRSPPQTRGVAPSRGTNLTVAALHYPDHPCTRDANSLKQRMPAIEPRLDGLHQEQVCQGQQRNRGQQRQR